MGRRPFAPSGLTISMAPAGQWRLQLPQLEPWAERQMDRSTVAVPILVELLAGSSRTTMAPVGQTSEQRVHSGVQYPAL